VAKSKRSADPRIPEKQYFRIGEAAEIAEVEPYVLRFWETEFPTLKPTKSKTNRRMYSRKDMQLVLRIRDLLYEDGYTIPGARRRLQQRKGPATNEMSARTKGLLKGIRNEAEEILRLVEE